MLQGHIHPDFAPVARELRRAITHRSADPGGAAVAVYHRGELVVDAWGGTRDAAGDPWTRDTAALSFSTTKGVVATIVHRLVDRGLIDVDAPVAEYWPEFAAAGKATITVRHLLSHDAAMHRLRGLVDDAYGMLDWDAVVDALAAAEPAWAPGTRMGYHGVTYGWLVGEVIRRVTGGSVDDALQREVAAPLGLGEMHIGWPADRRDDRADLLVELSPTARFEAGTHRAERIGALRPAIDAFVVPAFTDFIRSDAVYEAEVPALNGCFRACDLARLYSVLAADGLDGSTRYLGADTLRRATTVQRPGRRPDAVVGFPMAWRLGYHMAATGRGVIPNAFGHFGFGGSGAWASPDDDLAVAFTCNRVAGTPFGDFRMLRIGAAARRAARAR
ncbi:MAG: serine hydrolase domain-containing protein [Actinomycetes bacterium]